MKFNVGDLIVITETYPWFREGDVGRVTQVGLGHYSVDFNNLGNPFVTDDGRWGVNETWCRKYRGLKK